MIKKELQQELNRTKLVLDYARQEIKEKDKEIERLNNIIGEAIEYIELWHYRNDFRVNSFTTGVKEELLEILGGENNEKCKR